MIVINKAAIFVLYTVVFSSSILAAECSPLDGKARETILSHLAKRWNLGNPKDLSLANEQLIRDTCYRSFTLTGGTLKHPWTIFVSSDHRFVSGWLLDSMVDPEEEASDEAQRLNALLLSQQSPQRGMNNAHVTVVEFADFECPFCKRFDQWVKELPADARGRIRLVFKHLPLSQHPWARDASLMAACAELQSDEAFWILHDFIFAEQGSITSSNVASRINTFVSGLPMLNQEKWKHCITDRSGESVIGRDEMLAGQLQVNHTPTVFVNGERIGPVQSIGELGGIIEQAWRAQEYQSLRGSHRPTKGAEQ